MKSIRSVRKLENVPVLLRAALNVEVENGTVTNSFRLRKALPTIQYLQQKYARTILIGHISDTGTETLEPVYQELKKHIPSLEWCPVHVGKIAKDAIDALPPGGVLLLENLRRSRGESMNEESFAKELASLADIFVQDSFDVCHRKHASVVGVPHHLPSFAGLLVEEEVRELSKLLRPKRPSLAIIGGAKFTTKEPVLKQLLKTYDRVFVGGALANDFIQALGYPVGVSLVSHPDQSAVKELLQHKRLALPTDAVVAPLKAERTEGRIVSLREVSRDEAILDSGPETAEYLDGLVAKAKTVLWNGPLGNYEQGFVDGSEALAHSIASRKNISILGGGDTVAVVEKMGLQNSFTFISTGGGAMLDFIASGGTLPGLTVLNG